MLGEKQARVNTVPEVLFQRFCYTLLGSYVSFRIFAQEAA